MQRVAPGVRLEAVALEVEDIADAPAAGALDLAVGFLPGLGPPLRRRQLFRDRQGKFKSLPPPVAIPPADVGVHWHERFDADPGNRWLREQLLDLFAD